MLRTKWMLVGAALCALAIYTGCSDADGRLREFQRGTYEGVVVKDDQGLYWAIPRAGIDRISGSTIAIKAGTVLGRGEGSGTAADVDKEMASQLVDLMRKANAGGFGMTSFEMKSTGYTVSGRVEITDQPRDIVASTVVRFVEPTS